MVWRRLSPSTCAIRPGVPEYFRERGVANAEAAGIGAERRHHRALAVAGETSPLHRTAAAADPRLGMQMAGDLAGRAGRLMAKRNRPDRHFGCDHAAEIGRQRRIVIARYPDPVAPQLQCCEGVAVRRRQPAYGRCGRGSCRRARSPCADHAARSPPRAGSASPRYRRAAAARRGRRSSSLFPDADRRRRAGSALPRTTRRRDRRAVKLR